MRRRPDAETRSRDVDRAWRQIIGHRNHPAQASGLVGLLGPADERYVYGTGLLLAASSAYIWRRCDGSEGRFKVAARSSSGLPNQATLES
jgi:hypothetical protein